MNKLFKEDLYIVSVLISMFLGPIMMIGLVMLAVMDSMGIYTVMHHLAEMDGFSIAYVFVMLTCMIFGYGMFAKDIGQD